MDQLKQHKDAQSQMLTQNESVGSTTANQRRYVSEHQSCAMCDSELEIRHDINTVDLKVKEEAHCPSCGIRVRSSHHLMH